MTLLGYEYDFDIFKQSTWLMYPPKMTDISSENKDLVKLIVGPNEDTWWW